MEKTIKLENYEYSTDEILMDDIDLEIVWREMDNINYEILTIIREDEDIIVKYKLV